MKDFFDLAALRIGFQLPQYDYFEPDSQVLITNVTLIKEDNRMSEQTFAVSLLFGDPDAPTRPATLQQSSESSFDYLVSNPGESSITVEFAPEQTEVSVTFFLFPDDFPEGTEGFSINVTSQGDIFPNFQLPETTPRTRIPAFASTLVRILDTDRKFDE